MSLLFLSTPTLLKRLYCVLKHGKLIKIFIDGQDFTEHIDGIKDDFELEFGLDENTKTVPFSVSNELTFTKDAYDYLYDKFVSTCGISEAADVVIQLDCCSGKQLYFTLLPDAVQWNPLSCELTGSIKRKDENEDCGKILKEKIYWKGNGWRTAFSHPKIHYCRENESMSLMYSILFLILFPIIGVISVVQSVFSDGDTLVEKFTQLVTGCGRNHIGSLYRNIAEYNATKCGLDFQSTILQDDYKNLILFHGRNRKGCEGCDYIEDNMPALTTIGALDLLNPVFNADSRIIDGKLYYEPINSYNELYFGELVDISAVEYEDEPVFSFNQDNLKSYGRFEYSRDATDTEGNQVITLYNDIVEWNPDTSLSDTQRGELITSNSFSPVRFNNDTARNGTLKKIRGDDGHSVIMQTNISSNFKLILWDGASPLDRVIAEKRRSGRFTEYNYRLFYDENASTSELYQNYHYIKNPRHPDARLIVLEEFTFLPLDFCAALDLVLQYGIQLEVVTPYGSGIAEKITFNFASKSIKIENVFLKCNI